MLKCFRFIEFVFEHNVMPMKPKKKVHGNTFLNLFSSEFKDIELISRMKPQRQCLFVPLVLSQFITNKIIII